METRSNYVLVGAVTLAMLAGLLIFTVWLAGLSNKETKCFDIYFTEGVGGLNKGSNVTFNGVPVGQISRISLLPERPEFIWVRIDVERATVTVDGQRNGHARSLNPGVMQSQSFDSRPGH